MKTWVKAVLGVTVGITLLACEGTTPDTPKPTKGPNPDVVAACDAMYRSGVPGTNFQFNKKWDLPLSLETLLKSYDAAEDRGEDLTLRRKRLLDECKDLGVDF